MRVSITLRTSLDFEDYNDINDIQSLIESEMSPDEIIEFALNDGETINIDVEAE